jgi:predicted dehydrogenase
MALSVADCEAMTRAVLSAGRQLCVGHNWLYSPALLKAQALIAGGSTGPIVQAGASFDYDVRRNPSVGQAHWSKDLLGGLAEDLAVHLLAVLIHLLGAPQHTYSVSRPNAAVPNGKSADIRAVVEVERGLGALGLRESPACAEMAAKSTAARRLDHGLSRLRERTNEGRVNK